jgi:predicted ArsR family transcriptional regulator
MLQRSSTASASLEILGTLLAKSVADQGATLGATPEEAGAAWAQQHAPDRVDPRPATTPEQWRAKVRVLADVLREWGYSPQVVSEDGPAVDVRLHGCPFDALAAANPEIVCGIHRGLLSGAMAVMGEPDTEVSLDPFVAPRLCRVHLRQGPEGGDPTSG